ncbi:MAG: hypothetical protein JW762_01570 [Dehalococcoidales bacterium]|nr:hypothetical protein [Dehalococcoidales bacterium]
MSIESAIKRLNDLTTDGIIQGYAIAGGYAALFYEVPSQTFDLDVIVILGSDAEYHALYDYFRKLDARIEDVYIYIDDMPVQFLPNYINEMYNDAVSQANTYDFGNIRANFATPEHLILLSLTVYRDKDKIRMQHLIKIADKELIESLIGRFDDGEGKLYKRYQEVLERSENS